MAEKIPEISGNFPPLLGAKRKKNSLRRDQKSPAQDQLCAPFKKIRSVFGIALHMHQPVIPAEGDALNTAPLIGNLQHMMEHRHIGDNHNAPVFLRCYSRTADFVRELAAEGRAPRVMLDYSGCLLWGLKQMGQEQVLNNLSTVTADPRYYPYVEWLGTMWSHAVVPSTPVPDIALHVAAWQEHFASIFGKEALLRVKGFSAPEMHLPIHPDICHDYVKVLKEYGYEWLMVQENTIENLDGSRIRNPFFPHRLVAKNSLGQTETISVLVKTKGSDAKLVAQMQPYHEALSKQPEVFCGKQIPPYVFQIADGENGGVMMNDFPGMFNKVFREIGNEGVAAMNGTEYLECVKGVGITEAQFPPVQPVSQRTIWDHVKDFSPGVCEKAIEKIKKKDHRFTLEKGSWTNDKDWVKGYKGVISPMNELSILFHETFDAKKDNAENEYYKMALLHLLLSQTSCFRYWGHGKWTDYAKEICRRGIACVKNSA